MELENWKHVLLWLDPEDHAWAEEQLDAWGDFTMTAHDVLIELADHAEGTERHTRLMSALADFETNG